MSGILALFKGDNGAGKTVAAASFPDPVILDLDLKGPAVVRKHYPDRRIPYHQFGNALQAGELIERWDREGCPFETVIVDSLTALSYYTVSTMDEFRNMSILSVMQSLKQEGEKRGKDGKAPSVAKAMTELRGFDYYNAEDAFLKFYVDALKKMRAREGKKPNNVIFTAHVLTSESTNVMTEKTVRTRRILTQGQKIAAYIPAQFDDAWHFAVEPGEMFGDKKAKHFCFTEAVGEDYAKTAFRLDRKIDFTDKIFYDLIKDKLSDEPQIESNEIKTKTAKSKLDF